MLLEGNYDITKDW